MEAAVFQGRRPCSEASHFFTSLRGRAGDGIESVHMAPAWQERGARAHNAHAQKTRRAFILDAAPASGLPGAAALCWILFRREAYLSPGWIDRAVSHYGWTGEGEGTRAPSKPARVSSGQEEEKEEWQKARAAKRTRAFSPKFTVVTRPLFPTSAGLFSCARVLLGKEGKKRLADEKSA